MRHIPHLVVGAPWDRELLELSVIQWRHVNKVLRLNRGDDVTYSDGLGTIGSGRLANQSIERGEESLVERPTNVTIAVAPPGNKDRQRFLVEKLAELGVERLIWLKTAHGKDRVASPAKVFGWVLAATEQSRGAWLMDISSEPAEIGELPGRIVFCDPGGEDRAAPGDTVVIGPEGGFAHGEIPDDALRWSLGATILRVETAAVVAATLLSRN